jgi:hypothetical protein
MRKCPYGAKFMNQHIHILSLYRKAFYIAYKNENGIKVIEKIVVSQDLTSFKDYVLSGPEEGQVFDGISKYEDGKFYHSDGDDLTLTNYDELDSVTDDYILVRKNGTNETSKFFFTQEKAEAYLNSLDD